MASAAGYPVTRTASHTWPCHGAGPRTDSRTRRQLKIFGASSPHFTASPIPLLGYNYTETMSVNSR